MLPYRCTASEKNGLVAPGSNSSIVSYGALRLSVSAYSTPLWSTHTPVTRGRSSVMSPTSWGFFPVEYRRTPPKIFERYRSVDVDDRCAATAACTPAPGAFAGGEAPSEEHPVSASATARRAIVRG